MKENMFKYLPFEIIIDILARLPVRSVVCCKCVCKSWLHLVETNEFVKHHLSKSVPALLFYEYHGPPPNLFKIFDLEDGFIQLNKCYDLDRLSELKLVTEFNLPYNRWIYGSSDGLLLSHVLHRKPREIYICNPITRDCIKVPCPRTFVRSPANVTYGFGTSKITGQHKVVGISGVVKTSEGLSKCECQVYTLGTGSWRTIAPGPNFRYTITDGPAFLSGNLHWLVDDANDTPWICCFNLETELFSTFSTPSQSDGGFFSDVYVLGDCLVLYEYTSLPKDWFMWLMKDYGCEKSWTKYASVVNTFRVARVHTPSFLSLKSFAGEKVCSFEFKHS